MITSDMNRKRPDARQILMHTMNCRCSRYDTHSQAQDYTLAIAKQDIDHMTADFIDRLVDAGLGNVPSCLHHHAAHSHARTADRSTALRTSMQIYSAVLDARVRGNNTRCRTQPIVMRD